MTTRLAYSSPNNDGTLPNEVQIASEESCI